MKKTIICYVLMLVQCIANGQAEYDQEIFPGAEENTPSLSQYFSWINNTNEGSTAEQTMINLDFFEWLNREYGMVLDIYVISAGAIDKARWYGTMDSDEFRRQFPDGFGQIYEKAEAMGTRLGTWGGPDGFGNSADEEQARIDMMVKLCRDYDFRLLKFDAVVGQLRDDKQDAFIRMMTECRKYSPDLILLNHRLNLSEEARKHVTTSLWGGEETYIDVHMPNWEITAPHHRATALSREIVPGLKRLTEDHGVCISSCLDYWEDDLVLQAFNRSLLLSPQIYGNPWFLRDDEYPKLARIFNLTRQYRDIMTQGIVLPEEIYGEKAVSRGNENTRLITLRNISWESRDVNVRLNNEIGLVDDELYEARLIHPVERIIGKFRQDEEFTIEVEPFRSALLLICPDGEGGPGIKGCDYEVIQDISGKPLKINLLGFPGMSYYIELETGGSIFSRIDLEGKDVQAVLAGEKLAIQFPGEKLSKPYHRKLGDLIPCEVPEDAEALYEATVFAADNNALEVRSLQRSGETSIPEVGAAREAFINQALFIDRGLWDRYMFDDDLNTSFYVSRRHRNTNLINGGSLRLDFGKSVYMDELVVEVGNEYNLQPWKSEEAVYLEISDKLSDWNRIYFLAGTTIRVPVDPEMPVRFIRFPGTPERILEINAFKNGVPLNRKEWRGSHLFSSYRRYQAEKAWIHSVVLNEIPAGANLAICLEGQHGPEGAYAAIRVDGMVVGASDRSPSYPVNPWEYPVAAVSSHYTYYIPLSTAWEGMSLDIFVLGMKGGIHKLKPEVWLTTNPLPYLKKELKLFR